MSNIYDCVLYSKILINNFLCKSICKSEQFFALILTSQRARSFISDCIFRSCIEVHITRQAWSCVGRGIRAAPKSKIMRNPRQERRTIGQLSQFPDFNIDGCGESPARARARAPALSNVQTFALYFNFATLNMTSSSPPTSSTPALSSLRRVCNNSLIPGDERPESLLPRSSLSLTPSGKVHFNQATCLIWRYPRRTDNNR